MADTWWKTRTSADDVERFCDSNGDGIGNFKGLTSKLPYIAELGATSSWGKAAMLRAWRRA